MKRIRRFTSVLMLAAVLAASALAGETPTPGLSTPPPATASDGETPTPGASAPDSLFVELLLDITGSVLFFI
jgi:hypothetical protein